MTVRSALADWVPQYARRVRALGRHHLYHFRIYWRLTSLSASMASLDIFHEQKLNAASPEQLAELLRIARPLCDTMRRMICTLEYHNLGIWQWLYDARLSEARASYRQFATGVESAAAIWLQKEKAR